MPAAGANGEAGDVAAEMTCRSGTARSQKQPLTVNMSATSSDGLMEERHAPQSSSKKWCGDLRIAVAELVGTFILVVVTCGSSAGVVLYGAPVTIALLGSGAAVSLGVYVALNVSGGHLNPMVTVVFCMAGRAQWRLIGHYVVAQLVGGFLGAALTYACYAEAIAFHDPHMNTTMGIFSTYPSPDQFVGVTGAFVDITTTSFLFMLCLFATTDDRVMSSRPLMPLVIGFVVTSVLFGFGWNCGGIMNPARDLMPRLFARLLYAEALAPYAYNIVWMSVVAPLVGGVAAFGVFRLSFEPYY